MHHLFQKNTKDLRDGTALGIDWKPNPFKLKRLKQLEADYYERTDTRKGYRNGTSPHTLVTRVGSLTVKVPRLRNGDFSTDLFARYQRSEQAFILALMEMVVNGVSTRKVEHITYELCGETFSKSTIAELCKGLDPVITAWNNRPLSEVEYPFLIVEAFGMTILEDHLVRSRIVLLTVGVNREGYREVLGIQRGRVNQKQANVPFHLVKRERVEWSGLRHLR